MEHAGKTLICNVLFLDIVGYSKKSVVEQISVKERFNAYLKEAIRAVPIEDRVILDTGDGAAINFLGDVEDALQVAIAMQKFLRADELKQPALQVRMGINLGPVRLIRDINGHPNIIGDGINSSQRVMGFANPGQILVSRPYYEAMSNLSSKYSRLFRFEGSRTDKHHVREYELYAIAHPGEAGLGGTMAIIRNPTTVGFLLFLIAVAWLTRPKFMPPFSAPVPPVPVAASPASGAVRSPPPAQSAPSAMAAIASQASAPLGAPALAAAPAASAAMTGSIAQTPDNLRAAHAGKAALKIRCAKGVLVLVDSQPKGKIRKSEFILWLDKGRHTVTLVYPPKPVSYTADVVLTPRHAVSVSPREFCRPLK
jgi:class 3 adenylate cyclase